jgi:hypothetical protein
MFTLAIFEQLFSFLICSVESQEVFDAELSARVLQVINVTDSGLHGQVDKQESPVSLLNLDIR